VQLIGTSQQTKGNAKFFVQGLGVISDDFKTATFCGPVRSEGADDDMPAVPHRASHLANVGETVGCHCEKVKDSPVVPYVVCRGFKLDFGDVGGEPVHEFRRFAQPFLVRIDGSLRDVEDRDVLISTREKIIDQGGFTAANIDDGSRATRSRLSYECE
jgi:hypothetical protein